MLATDYIAKGDSTGAIECMRNIYLARTKAIPDENPYYKLLRLQTDWEKLMDFFSSDKVADGAIALSGLKR